MFNTVRDRIGAACGAAFVAMIFIGSAMNTSGTVQSGHVSGQAALGNAAHQATRSAATAGLVLELLGFVAFMGFLGYLADALRRRIGTLGEGGMLGGTAIVAGTAMVVLKLGSAVPEAVLFLDRQSLTPQLAQVLNDMGTAGFVLAWLPFGAFVGTAAAGLQRASLIGRPTTAAGVLLGLVGVVLAAVGLHDPVHAQPVAWLLGLLWVFVVSIRLVVRPGERRSASIAAGDRVAVAA